MVQLMNTLGAVYRSSAAWAALTSVKMQVQKIGYQILPFADYPAMDTAPLEIVDEDLAMVVQSEQMIAVLHFAELAVLQTMHYCSEFEAAFAMLDH